jgi:2-keto-4-pentenoate hydratase/2-oxohepta-3-ene-1,7-dioic acid hydratase in catechol pathway
MKLFSGTHGGQTVAGWLDGETAVICAKGPEASRAVLAVIAGGEASRAAWAAVEGPREPLSEVHLLAPMPEPLRDILCVGKNYYAHAAEFFNSGFDSSAKEQVPSAPVIFTKPTTSVCGPGDTVLGSLDPRGHRGLRGRVGRRHRQAGLWRLA